MTTTHELHPGETLTIECIPDRRPALALAFAVAALIVATVALAFALVAATGPESASRTQTTNAAAFASHRGGKDVVRHKARTCWTNPVTGRRYCTVRWVHTVRDRSSLEAFRSRYA